MRFTPVEVRMLWVLSDGDRHHNTELQACLNDDQGHHRNISFHIKNLRHKLRHAGQEIVCEVYKGRYYYRHIVLLRMPSHSPKSVTVEQTSMARPAAATIPA